MKASVTEDDSSFGGVDELAMQFIRAADDETAAAEVYRRCRPLLAAWLSRRFPLDLAENSAHDAMAEAFAESARFQTSRALMPWLKSLAFHCAIDSVRKASRRAERERVFVEYETLSEGAHGDVAHRLAPALAGLNAQQRELIERRFLLGESSEAIAESEGKNRTAVAVEIHRICRRMRKAFEESAAN